jgi:excinuclease ABC subunit C
MSIFSDKKQDILGDKSLPDTPGVYFFVDAKREILYIGKATSLRDRVRSYFSQDIAAMRGPKIVRMLERVADVQWQVTDSVLEALLLEAELIKAHQPKYNTDEKDDKSFFFAVITKERFPRVILVRGRERARAGVAEKYVFGPFPQGGSLKEALKIVRRIFPFRDTCKPFDEGQINRKPCFNAQIGLCPGVCSGVLSAQEYAKTIRRIKLFFEGKKSLLKKRLEKEMHDCVNRLEFERANEVKKTLFALDHIQDVALLKKEARVTSRWDALRIEAYDVAHLSGKETVGVMTVIGNGERNPSQYRRFKVSQDQNDDVGSLREILARRFNRKEWSLPGLIVLDGFDAHIRIAKEVLSVYDLDIPVVSVVKDNHHKPKDIVGGSDVAASLIPLHRDAILLANAEAHRFAITFHRARRKKGFLD